MKQAIESVLSVSPNVTMVVKSTVPVGYTERLCELYPLGKFLFFPGFLRRDSFNGSFYSNEIIVGVPTSSVFFDEFTREAECFSTLLAWGTDVNCMRVFICSSTEAEAMKLFADAYRES